MPPKLSKGGAAHLAPPAKMPMGKLLVNRPAAAAVPSAADQQYNSRNTTNKLLQYSQPDASPIPHPSTFGAFDSLIAMIDGDRTTYPFRKYRYVDYLITALDMFVVTVKAEHAKQNETARKAGRAYSKFTWGNKGELAICYTLTCDMLKILHDKLAVPKPKLESLIDQMNMFLIRVTQIPTDVLTEKTYKIKYLDWKKGGTRYNADDHANVRFPSAEERLKKLEVRIQTGAVYELQSTVIEAPVAPAAMVVAPAPAAVTGAPVVGPLVIGSKTAGVVVSSVQPPTGPGPLSNRTKVPPSGTASFKQPHEMTKQANWITELNAIKGNANLLLLPRDRLDKMPLLINMCAKSDTAEQFCVIADLISQSPVDVQSAFEAQGGLVFVKRWLCSCLRMKHEAAVRTLAERTVSMKLRAWSAKTRAAWHNGCINLDWLRAAEFLGMKPQLWNETVSRLEALAMTPLEADVSTGVSAASSTGSNSKRPRDVDWGDSISSQGGGTQNKRPSVSFFNPPTVDRAVVLAEHLRFAPLQPELMNTLEASTLCTFVERRKSFATRLQAAIEDRIQTTGRPQLDVQVLPLLFNPYALLGVPAQEVATQI